MGHLAGLKDYLDTGYKRSVFDQACASHTLWTLHLHGQRIVQTRIVENHTYDLKVAMADAGPEELAKIQVKYLYPAELSAAIKALIKVDKQVAGLKQAPILEPSKRYFIKNKTLFPLMEDKQVLFLTLLEGEIIRGIIADFSQYDITINLKGGIPVVILRHSIYDARDKTGRCLLKTVQDDHKDWQKSPLFVPS
jgi:hypothetical protein